MAEYEEEYGLKFLYEYGTPDTELLAEIEPGEIYKQTPPAGTMVGADATITVTICNGDLEIVDLPNVIGQEASRAQFVLVHEGFEVEVVSEHSEEMAEGCVIRTDPAFGSKLAPGSKIKLFVSLGELKEPVEVPDVTRHSLEEAKKLIEQAGFKVGTVSQVNSEPNFKGYVVRQSPAGGDGKMAEKGTAINLYVGNGITLYKFNLNVALPYDYINDHGFISAWIDNAQVSADQYTGKVEISKLKNATFNITTEKQTVQVTIKLSPDNVTYHDYITYTIDATTGNISDLYQHSYPQKIEQGNDGGNTNNSSDMSGGTDSEGA